MTKERQDQHNLYMSTKILYKISLFLLLSFLSHQASAYSTEENCPKKITSVNNLQFSRAYQDEIAECWISIDNMNGYQKLIYRSYLITSDGLLMVFNSYGSGPNSTHTGARMFYFFPREIFSNEVKLEKDLVSVRLNSKVQFQFQTKVLNLVDQENFKVKTDPKINRNNKGGVEIQKYDGVFLDVGFSMGKSPTDNPERFSVFKNQLGQSCQVLNKQIFDYKGDDNYLHGDNVLKATVERICPDFKWQD